MTLWCGSKVDKYSILLIYRQWASWVRIPPAPPKKERVMRIMNDTMIGHMYKNGQISIVSACRMLYEHGYNRKSRREIMARWIIPSRDVAPKSPFKHPDILSGNRFQRKSG